MYAGQWMLIFVKENGYLMWFFTKNKKKERKKINKSEMWAWARARASWGVRALNLHMVNKPPYMHAVSVVNVYVCFAN